MKNPENISGITLATKCAPREEILSLVKESGITAVELYLSEQHLDDLHGVIEVCNRHYIRYSIHAPNDVHVPGKLAELCTAIKAEVAVFHNIYFDDEWETMSGLFKNTGTKICIENVSSVLDPLKFMRRHGFGMCLDMEHIQLECAGIFSEGFDYFMKQASHIHMSGYIHGTETWHTHLHRNPEHCVRQLDMLSAAGYSGWVVSEARTEYQTAEEFRGLKEFFDGWAASRGGASG